MKLYKVEQDKAFALNVRRPALSSIKLEEGYKACVFLDCLIGEVLVPLMSQGEKGKERTRRAAKEVRKMLEWHLEEEVAERSVSGVADISCLCRAVLGLCPDEPFAMVTFVPSADKVKSFFRVVGESLMHMLANSLCESAY